MKAARVGQVLGIAQGTASYDLVKKRGKCWDVHWVQKRTKVQEWRQCIAMCGVLPQAATNPADSGWARDQRSKWASGQRTKWASDQRTKWKSTKRWSCYVQWPPLCLPWWSPTLKGRCWSSSVDHLTINGMFPCFEFGNQSNKKISIMSLYKHLKGQLRPPI